MGIGDVQRQTAVGETTFALVHPGTLGRRGPNPQLVPVDDIGRQLLHGRKLTTRTAYHLARKPKLPPMLRRSSPLRLVV